MNVELSPLFVHIPPFYGEHLFSVSRIHVPPFYGEHLFSVSRIHIPPFYGEHLFSVSRIHIPPFYGEHLFSVSRIHVPLFMVNIYFQFQEYMFSNGRDITKCYSFCTTTPWLFV